MSIVLNRSLRLFLDSIGRRDEYEYYLERFRAPHDGCFALIVPEAEGFDRTASVVAFDVDFLLRVGLDPAIVLCGAEASEMATALGELNTGFSVSVLSGGLGDEALVLAVSGCIRHARAGAQVAVLALPDYERGAALQALVPALTHRLHYLRAAGPLRDGSGDALPFYYTRDPERVALVADDESLVVEADALLDRAPGLHVSVASPLQLLEELFTVRGAGCLIRRGCLIETVRDMGLVDVGRLAGLMEESFSRKLREPADLLSGVSCAILSGEYQGAALLRDHPVGGYLSKFAVDRRSRGEGLAQELWRVVAEQYPVLFWRSRPGNVINQWYERKAAGRHGTADWIVYWRGVGHQDIPALVDYCLAQPTDFV